MRSFAKVFLVLFIPVFIALALTFYFIHGMMSDSARHELLQEMKHKWVILARQSEDLEQLTPQSHARLAALSQETSLRITLVNRDGRVLLDSLVPYDQIPAMENHKGRPEIKAAIYGSDGFATRYSHTLQMPMFYYARTLSDNKVLRLAYPSTYVASLQQQLTSQALWAFACLSVVLLALALYFARKVSLPVQKLNYIADRVEAGKTHVHFPSFKDPSMANIAGLIYRIYSSMQKQNLQLKRDQQTLSYIFGTMDQGVVLLDRQDVILHANAWMSEEFGVAFEPGKSLFQATNNIHQINFFKELLQAGKESFRTELGKEVFEVSLKRVEDQTLVLLRNVTRQAEYEMFKTELTGNISHELKTPLSMIMGYAETLRDTPQIAPETRQRFLENIYNSSQRLNQLINDIIELHKLESVGDDFRVDEAVALEQIAGELREYYAELETPQLQIAAGPGAVRIFPEHLHSVLTNLIDNAVKYASGERIEVRLQLNKEVLKLTVDDQGPRIAEAERERIFERFYTCSRSRNKQHSGTGLGLSIVKHVANIYAGSVRLEGSPLGGNRFLVLLPQKPLSD